MADLILYIHCLYVLCVILPVPLIIIGGIRGWKFVRNVWFRMIHLLLIVIVVMESVFGIPCPLTVWEYQARYENGTSGYDRSFLSEWVADRLFYEFDPWIFTVLYISYFQYSPHHNNIWPLLNDFLFFLPSQGLLRLPLPPAHDS